MRRSRRKSLWHDESTKRPSQIETTMIVETQRLRGHIAELTKTTRPAESEALELARQYVTERLCDAGWLVSQHAFRGEPEIGPSLNGINLIAESTNNPPSTGTPRLCVGAHLDSRPETPGADDNASAVAALLEIARLLPGNWPAEPKLDLELVVFDLEENGMLGGAEHARLSTESDIDLRGMVSLEMLGYCDHTPGSQSLPKPLIGMYPDVGNFIAIIGNQNSDTLIREYKTGMQCVGGLPIETLAVPSNGEYFQATRLSDHSPFWDAGYPALMITDTSFLRNPHYHMPTDTLDTLDMEFLQKVAQGSFEAVRHMIATGL